MTDRTTTTYPRPMGCAEADRKREDDETLTRELEALVTQMQAKIDAASRRRLDALRANGFITPPRGAA